MPYETDGLVGKLALQKGLLTSAQLKECLAEQAALSRSGQKRPLGVLMVSRGLMKDEDLLDLLEEQRRYLAERANYAQVRKEDFLFGQILLKQGIATSEEINAALRAQADAAERGEMPVPRLGQFLMDMGVSDEKTIERTLKIQYKTLYECPGCTLRYNLVEARPEKQYRCRKCGAILVPKPPGGGVKADESAYGLKLEVAENLPPEVVEAERSPANRFDRYVLLEEIGRGGMGTVYRAYQKELKRTVAIKLLRPGDEETRERFIREAQTAGRLKHPGIVSVYEIGRAREVPYLAMEYVDGKPLDRLGRLPAKKACQILRDVANAVQYAHEKGVIHRDLKPQNILIDKDGRACVTDFGLAREVARGKDLTLSGVVVGTPAYMSPEQAQGVRDLDGRSDVASLGAVLYELLTGVQPYAGSTALDVALAVIHKDAVPLRRLAPTVPAELEAVCMKALDKNRDHRYLTARAFAEDLQRFVEGEAVLARPRSVVNLTFRRLRRNKTASGIAIAGVLAVAVTLGVLSSVLSDSRAKAALLEARDLERKGRLEEALRMYRKVPEAAPEAERVLAEMGRRDAAARREAARREARGILAQAGPQKPPAERAALATRALASSGDLEEAFVVRAQAHLESGDDAAAYEDLGRAAGVSASPLPHHAARAEIARSLGRLADEIGDLTLAIEIQALSGDLRIQRAAASTRLARRILHESAEGAGGRIARLLNSAEDDLSHAGRHPLLEGARRELGVLLQAVARPPAALRRGLAAAFTEAAYDATFEGRQAAALRNAERAVEADPGFEAAYVARGLCHFSAGRTGEARADAARALDLKPSCFAALAVRGLARVQESLRTLEEAAPADLPAPARGYEPQWIAEFAEGCVDLQEFAEHGRTRPRFRTVEESADALLRSVPAKAASDGTGARAHLAASLVARGARLREKKDYGCAIRALSVSLALDAGSAAAWLERGECRFLAQDFASAAADWERALSLDAALRARLEERIRDARVRSGG